MKKSLLLTAYIIIYALTLQAQVTQINNNNSLKAVAALTSSKAIAVSKIDSSIWITDASLPGTVQIATPVKYESFGSLLSGKLVFRGSTPATGSEIYITDGTAGGTTLVSDISPGATGSAPNDFGVLNGFVYFSATRAAEGRELWRTDGTPAGTTLVKDIVPGPDSSNTEGNYHLTSNGSYLLFAANNPSTGVELWKSDGTGAGTILLKDINAGNAGADSSNPNNFYLFNNLVLFTATDATHGKEVWKTDGSSGGTVLVKDINPGTGSFTSIPGFSDSIFGGFHTFNNRVYLQAFDGTSTGELWSTDGTTANTILLKDIVPGTSRSFVSVTGAVNTPNKFIFPVSDDAGTRSELWQSDGTPGGTVLFKSFTPVVSGDIPVIFVPFNPDPFGSPFVDLFQETKFFFAARTPTQGYELWIGDYITGVTNIVKDINPGVGDGIELTGNQSGLYIFRPGGIFGDLLIGSSFVFAANDGTHGNELWKTDGTDAGTSMIFDINPNTNNADPHLLQQLNDKVMFSATDGDDPMSRDLFVIDTSFLLPIKLASFTASREDKINKLEWVTASEQNTNRFEIQRSNDGIHFTRIGEVKATGNSSVARSYSFNDANPVKGINYYRLRIVDIDNSVTYSNIIAVRTTGSVNFTIYPNPVKSTLFVNMDAQKTEIVDLSITDINGRKVYSKKVNVTQGNNNFSVDVNRFSKGTYNFKVQLTNGSFIKKFNKL